MINKKGTTLVELIMAMVIIAIVAVSALEFFNFCQKNFIIPVKPKLVASNFAREKMEEQYWQPGALLNDGTSATAPLSGWTMTSTISTNPAGYKKIDVTIKK